MLKNAFVLFVYSFVTLVVKYLKTFNICHYKISMHVFSLQQTDLLRLLQRRSDCIVERY